MGRGRVSSLLVLALLAAGGCSDAATDSQAAPALSLDFEGSSLGDWSVTDQDELTISVRTDTNASTAFWFAFQVDGGQNRSLTFRLRDATAIASPNTWSVKRPVASADGGRTWVRIHDTGVTEAGEFVFRHTPSSSAERIALALPYQVSRWDALVSELEPSPWVRSVRVIGQSIGGVPVDLLEITDPSVSDAGKSGIWVVARQHPGEPEGSFMVEGFLEWLVGDAPEATELRRRARIFVAGFLNPDGVLAGNQRVNLAGLDVNRQWREPTPATAPTVLAFQTEMLEYVEAGGDVRILIDFHGAPGGRSNFFFYNEAATSTPAVHAEVVEVMQSIVRHNPDFVPLEGSVARPVPNGERGRNWAFDRLGTHGLTVEGGANDVTYGPFQGEWITEPRLKALGAAVGMGVAELLYGIDSPLATAGASVRRP